MKTPRPQGAARLPGRMPTSTGLRLVPHWAGFVTSEILPPSDAEQPSGARRGSVLGQESVSTRSLLEFVLLLEAWASNADRAPPE